MNTLGKIEIFLSWSLISWLFFVFLCFLCIALNACSAKRLECKLRNCGLANVGLDNKLGSYTVYLYTYDFFISRPLIGRAIGVVNLYDNWTRQLKWRIHMCILLETCLLGVLSLNLVSWVEFRPPLPRDWKPRASPSASNLWAGEALNSTQLTKFSHTTPCKHVSNILFKNHSSIQSSTQSLYIFCPN